ncbi:MAG TPA: amidohydrolase family protein [Rhizomicrobium sp.]|jgi:imidazolonepropionase-like amidohydrolase
MRTAISVLALLLSTAAAQADGNSFVIRDARVFDGEKTIAHADVVVKDGKITAVGAHLAAPNGVAVYDGRGKTVIPGLIDSHVHTFPTAPADALRFGITTELDMFDIGQDIGAWKKQRESLTRTDQADVWAAGIGVTAPGGHPSEFAPPGMMPTLASAADAKAFIDARVAAGSDYIKVFIEDLSEYPGRKPMPTLTKDEVCAVVAAAHADHVMTTIHVQAEWAAREAIDCGTDGLAHMYPDKIADPAVVADAKAHHIFIETTASVWAGASGLDLAQKLGADPRVAPYLSGTQKQSLFAGTKHPSPQFFPNVVENLRLYHEAGVPLLPGTDAPNPATAHGPSLHEELQIFVQAGYTPEQALNAATALPTRIFHLGDRGHIAPGYRADLILIDGDPTTKISDTLSIARIWKNGYAIDRTPPKADPRGPAPGGAQ